MDIQSLSKQQEQQRVNNVLELIEQQLDHLEDKTGQLRDDVVDIRKHFWDDVTVNKENEDDLLETFISMKQQAEVLSQRERSHRHAFKRLSALRRLRDTPYFGRIDFAEEGFGATEQIYIGVSSLTDHSGEHFLIYDWRAPISSVYYDYPPGPAQYATPGGIIRGELKQKWQYTIRGGVIDTLFDTSETIGDELLQQVLGRSSNPHMRSIVATIQQEQNRIIRHDQGRLLIVQGAAGSGKTSAALQRIAYLLYTYRDRLKADQIILFSPNAMFNSYVSTVLPELGEENMQQATFQEYLTHRLSSYFRVEDPFEQLEYLLSADRQDPEYQTRLASIRFKASAAFFDAVKAYRQSLEQSGMPFRGIQFRGKSIVSRQEMTERFYSINTTMRFHNRLELLTEWLNEQIDEFEKLERSQPWVQEEIELLSNEDYQRAYAQTRKKNGYRTESFDDYDREQETLSRMIVRRKLKPLRERIRSLRYIDMTALYKRLFSDPARIADWLQGEAPGNWADICRYTVETIDAGRLDYEDATPYLLLKELIEGFQTNNAIKFILVDEAQDYSPFQFEFLKRLFPAAKMTVLGDFNQAIFAHAQHAVSFDSLNRLYGEEETELMNLSRSYRSTRQIVEFTRRLVPAGASIIAFERDGNEPTLNVVDTREELHARILGKMKKLQHEGCQTIAIICKSAAESVEAYDVLQSGHHSTSAQNSPDIKLITTGSIAFEQGIVVIPAYLAKGIEFDAVILYNCSNQVYGDESLRRLFYTACTRAMHELHLFSLGEPSFILQDRVGSRN